jgi:hypothetical protein
MEVPLSFSYTVWGQGLAPLAPGSGQDFCELARPSQGQGQVRCLGPTLARTGVDPTLSTNLL